MTVSTRFDTAFSRVRRVDFLPRDQRNAASQDTALRIGYGQTNSQPSTVRRMLELLEVAPGQRVLDVGCGSGWTTALLGELVGAEGEVVGVEIVPELVEWGRANLAAYSMPWTSISPADPAVLGLPAKGPFDRILVSAAATVIPSTLVDQLVEGGLLVVPVVGRMTVVRRTAGAPEVRREGYYSFVPLLEP